MNQTRIEDLRCTESLTTMKTLLEARRPDVAILAGRAGVKSGRNDRYPESIHKLHAKLGELLLDDEDQRRLAWEHLLSAAFGLPNDGMINLNLGRFYESEERHRRAMSRYVQAVVQPESGPMAVKALENLQKKMSGEPLSVDLVDRLIAGKVYNFGAATRFEADEQTDTNRVVLAELFTNGHFGRRLKEGWRSFAIGGAMACEGLLSHFPRERLAVLVHHVEKPEPTALMNPVSERMVSLYGDDRPVYFKINGRLTGPGAERWRKGEQLYEANRQLVIQELAEPSDWTITAEGEVKDGIVSGTVTVKGDADPNLTVEIILAERGVLYPGKAQVVVNRMVVRGALTEKLSGVPFKPEAGEMRIPFKRALADITKTNEAFLSDYEKSGGGACTRLSTKIDPRQVTIVAALRDRFSNEVMQAVQINPKGAEPQESRR